MQKSYINISLIVPKYLELEIEKRIQFRQTIAPQSKTPRWEFLIFMCRVPESNWARLPLQGSALPMS